MSTYALGKIQVRRSGYGAMQLAGPFAFGTPPDRASAIKVLKTAVSAGVDHIDTAQYYGPGVVNDLIREALHPYPGDQAFVARRHHRGELVVEASVYAPVTGHAEVDGRQLADLEATQVVLDARA